MKLIILIIASDDLEIYREEQKFWRKYMNSYQNITSYFIKGGVGTEPNTLYFNTPENLQPGIVNKTIMALKKISDNNTDFDYIVRTNLSSFFIFPRLLEFLQQHKDIDYSGVPINGFSYNACSGAGIILSKKAVNTLVEHFDELYNHEDTPDDLIIGEVLTKYNIAFTPATRQDILSMENFDKLEENYEIFHFRVKQIYCHPHNRTNNEIYILNELYKKYIN
jgi:hypothetical protein